MQRLMPRHANPVPGCRQCEDFIGPGPQLAREPSGKEHEEPRHDPDRQWRFSTLGGWVRNRESDTTGADVDNFAHDMEALMIGNARLDQQYHVLLQ